MRANWKIKILIIIIIFFNGKFKKNVTAFNSFLTYTFRLKKLILIPNITGNYIINNYRNFEHYSGNVSINFKETPNKVIVTFNRCNSEGINCEYFQTWTITDFCSKLKENNQIWSSAIRSFHPRMECPLERKYQVINGTVDLGPLIRLYPDVTEYQWKITGKAYFDNLFLGGTSFDFSIFGYKKRIKSTFIG